MNNDKHVALERLAREAGLHNDGAWWFDGDSNAQCDVSTAALARFAALVRADALEQAATIKTFPQVAIFPAGMEFAAKAYEKGMEDYAVAVRALKDAP